MPLPTFARNGLCWELWGSLGFLRHKPTSPCRALCKPFSFFSSKLWHFGIVWPHCVMGTWTCLLITVGVTAWTLQVWTQSPKAYVLVVAGASPLKSDHDWRVSSCPHGARSGRVGAPTKPPMMLGAGRVLDSLFLLEQPETQEVVLPWPEEGRCGQCAAVSPTFHRSLPSIASTFHRVYFHRSLPSIAVYLPSESVVVVVVLDVVQPHLPHSRILSMVSCFWKVVSLLLRGTEVSNSLCHPLGDVTLKYIFIYGMR